MTTEHTLPTEKTISQLFADTLSGEGNDERAWNAVQTLRVMGTPEVFEKAVEFCHAKESLKRVRGLNILAQFGCGLRDPMGPYSEERIVIALKYLSDESENVVEAAAWALSNMGGEKATRGLLAVRNNSNAEVRHAVAAGLAGQKSAEAVDALIELMQDPINYVRDWATFSLGQEFGDGLFLDTPEIRDALHGRLEDTDDDTRSEAIWGLALRLDSVGLRMLLARLRTDKWVSGDEETAIHILNMPENATLSDLCDGLDRLLTKSE